MSIFRIVMAEVLSARARTNVQFSRLTVFCRKVGGTVYRMSARCSHCHGTEQVEDESGSSETMSMSFSLSGENNKNTNKPRWQLGFYARRWRPARSVLRAAPRVPFPYVRRRPCMVKCIAGLGGGSKSLTSRSRSSGCSLVARGVARALYPPHHALRHPSPAMVWLCVSAGGLLVHVCHRQSVRLPVRVCLEFDVLSRGLCRARASSLSACPRYRALWTARCSLGRVTISQIGRAHV